MNVDAITLTKLWQDRMILDLPAVDRQQLLLHPLDEAVSKRQARISLGFTVYRAFHQPLLQLVTKPVKAPDLPYPEDRLACLACFDTDFSGKPIPKSAQLHVALSAIKTAETDGNLRHIVKNHQKHSLDFRKKLAQADATDHRLLQRLIDWLAGFLPTGCSLLTSYSTDLTQTIRPLWYDQLFTFPQSPGRMKGALRAYMCYLLGNDTFVGPIVQGRFENLDGYLHHYNPRVTWWQHQAQPAIWSSTSFHSFPKDMRALVSDIKRNAVVFREKLMPIAASDEKTRTSLTLELVAQYLVAFSQHLPPEPKPLEKAMAQLHNRPISDKAAGLMIFTDDKAWLDKLERRINAVSPLAYQVPFTELPATEPSDTRTSKAMFQSLDEAFRIKLDLDLRSGLLFEMRHLRSQLKRASEKPVDEKPIAPSEAQAAKLAEQHKNLDTARRQVNDLQMQLQDLTAKQSALRQSGELITYAAAEKLIGDLADLERSLRYAQSDAEKQARWIADLMHEIAHPEKPITDPRTLITQKINRLKQHFDRGLLKSYDFFSIKDEAGIIAVSEKIALDSHELAMAWLAPSLQALGHFFRFARTDYVALQAEYLQLRAKDNLTDEDLKRLLAMHRHHSVPFPVRLFTFDQGEYVLEELSAGRLQMAIVDCTTPPSHIFLGNLCQCFDTVVLLNADRASLVRHRIPESVNQALRKKRGAEGFPPHC